MRQTFIYSSYVLHTSGNVTQSYLNMPSKDSVPNTSCSPLHILWPYLSLQLPLQGQVLPSANSFQMWPSIFWF